MHESESLSRTGGPVPAGPSYPHMPLKGSSMKKFALALASISLVLGTPSVALASSPACGYEHTCDDDHSGKEEHHHDHHQGGGANATGAAIGSPGVLSGNVIQIPINIPINICGNSINVFGALNPAFGNTCINA